MADLKSITAVYFALAFLAPGLVICFVRSQFVTGRRASNKEETLSYLTLSIIYYALVFPAVDYALDIQEPGYKRALTWFALVFIGPTIFGLLLGLNAQKGIFRRVLQRVGLQPVHVMRTAWDWKFGSITESFVFVLLKDGTKYAGYCGLKSFMASDPNERDLYIEKVYDVDEENKWHGRENGLLIAAGEVRTIEIWEIDRSKNNDTRKNAPPK